MRGVSMLDQKFRVSAKTLKALPEVVRRNVLRLQERYEFKSFHYEVQPEGYKHYMGEDERNTVIYKETVETVQMVGSHNVGAADVSYRIGDRVAFPAGTVILNI